MCTYFQFVWIVLDSFLKSQCHLSLLTRQWCAKEAAPPVTLISSLFSTTGCLVVLE